MASVEALVFIFSLLDTSCLLFLAVYFIITLSDLECDYINATQCCSRLNKWVVPELAAALLVTVLQLYIWQFFLFLINASFVGWLLRRYLSIPVGNIGQFDPAEIHNRHQLKSDMREAMVKLGYHLIFFFVYLYSMIMALISDG